MSVPYLRVANVQRGFLVLGEVKYVDVTKEKLDELRLQHGDVLFNEGGDRDKLGRGWIWEDQIKDCIHQNHVFRARLIPEMQIPKLVSHYANELGRDYFFNNASQSVNLASINKTQLSRLPIPLVPVDEQAVLERKILELLSFQESLQDSIRESEDRLNQLSDSILSKAFRGELIIGDRRDCAQLERFV